MSEKVDELKELRGVAMSEDDFIKEVAKKQDDRFKDLKRNIVFEKVKQEDGSFKLMGRLSDGVILFPDWKEDESKIIPGIPYICLVYRPIDEETGRKKPVAFAKIICEENIPKLFLGFNDIVQPVWRDKKGKFRAEPIRVTDADIEMFKKSLNLYHVRILKSILMMQSDVKVPYLLVVFRDNETV